MMKRVVVAVIICGALAIAIFTGIYNFFNNCQFMDSSITQVLTLIVTIGVAFWATQYKNDLRKTKENAESVIEKLQTIVSNECFYSIPANGNVEEVKKNINCTNRKINNCIDILEQYASTLKFENDIKYIREQFESYKRITGDHILDLDYLSKSELEFRRIADNIDTKCDYIILSLYK